MQLEFVEFLDLFCRMALVTSGDDTLEERVYNLSIKLVEILEAMGLLVGENAHIHLVERCDGAVDDEWHHRCTHDRE